MKKIAIWGSYNYGNFGDDVMALMYAIKLKDLGITPIVFRFNEKLASTYGIETTKSLDALLQNSESCLLGGGTVLFEPLSGKFGGQMNTNTKSFYDAIQKWKTPLYSVSIGSDDSELINRQLTYFQWEVLKSANFNGGTVRLESDEKLYNFLNKPVERFSDVVLSTSKFWPVNKPKKPNSIDIGFTFIHETTMKWFIRYVKLTRLMNPKISLTFFSTHLKDSSINDIPKFARDSKQIRIVEYEDPKTLMSEMSQMDLIITNKLHPAIAALSYGVPFLNFDKRPKTLAVLNSLGLESTVRSLGKDLLLELKSLTQTHKLQELKKGINNDLIAKHQENSLGHFKFIQDVVENLDYK